MGPAELPQSRRPGHMPRLPAVLPALLLAACVTTSPDYRADDAPAFQIAAADAAPRPTLALVLGGGGPRGFAHIGVIKALQAEGIVPDLIVGTSSGAFVGALYAALADVQELERRAMELSRSDIADFSILAGRTLVGQALQDYVNRNVGHRPLEALRPPVVVVATRREDGKRAVFNRGNVGVAVRASSAQPGNYLPVMISGVAYVDGDAASPVPIRLAKELGARYIIAVDVSQNVRRAPAPVWAPPQWTEEAVARRSLIEAESAIADVIVEPALPYLVGFDAEYRRMAIAAGEQAAREALPRLKSLAAAAQTARQGHAAPSRDSGRRQPVVYRRRRRGARTGYGQFC